MTGEKGAGLVWSGLVYVCFVIGLQVFCLFVSLLLKEAARGVGKTDRETWRGVKVIFPVGLGFLLAGTSGLGWVGFDSLAFLIAGWIGSGWVCLRWVGIV